MMMMTATVDRMVMGCPFGAAAEAFVRADCGGTWFTEVPASTARVHRRAGRAVAAIAV